MPHKFVQKIIDFTQFRTQLAGDLNLDKAEALLREVIINVWFENENFLQELFYSFDSKNLRWRKEYRMDEILDEDFKTMEQQYPIDLDGIDYEGRPGRLTFIFEASSQLIVFGVFKNATHLRLSSPSRFRG
jgi:hypothetical protein